MGDAPIDIGIWVGGEISPNRFDQARELVEEVRSGKSDARYKLLLERCPWCAAPLDANQGYQSTDDDFYFHCVDRECEFGTDARPLPCNVVDEALYERPPSLLIATIDKFARVAWEERTGAFFGAGTRSRPPELVIQDELHLITGPLGSVAGMYEAGLDTLLVRRGVRPKYIASTATIRMAREQVRRLYARELAVFPPPGLVSRRFVLRTHGSRASGTALRRLPGPHARPAALHGSACRCTLAGRSALGVRRRLRSGTNCSMRGGPWWSTTAA